MYLGSDISSIRLTFVALSSGIPESENSSNISSAVGDSGLRSMVRCLLREVADGCRNDEPSFSVGLSGWVASP